MLPLLFLLPLTTAAPFLLESRQDTLPPAETWAIRGLWRSCSEFDSVCQFHFTIDTGAPLPGDPMPAPSYSTSSRSAILKTLNDNSHHDSSGTIDEDTAHFPGGVTTAITTTTLTECNHFISNTPTTPASRGTSFTPTQCGAFQISSGWSHVRSDGTSVSGAEAADVDGAVGHGFTVLSIVDRHRNVLIWASANDEEILSANAAAAQQQQQQREGEVGVLGDRRYAVESVP